MNVFKMKKGRLNIDMKGRSNLCVGRGGQTDQLALLSLALPSGKKRCSVDLGWLLFCLVVPIRMHFLCGPTHSLAMLAAEQGLPQDQLLGWRPFFSVNSLLVGALDRILLLLFFFFKVCISI